MARGKIASVCGDCGQESLKWIGKCPNCGRRNTFKEFRIAADTSPQAARNAATTLHNAASGGSVSILANKPQRLRDISSHDDPHIDMRDGELNRVLDGGLVPGSIVLLGGEPGTGKSTLTLQTIPHMTQRVLYISGEGSPHQIKMRVKCISKDIAENIIILSETSLEHIFEHIHDVQPELVVIDLVQITSTEDVDSSPGSITQVRECVSAPLCSAKTSGVPVILIGYINKEGGIAGPKILEHIVDTVIQLEGDQHYMYRILRSIKNRFSSTSELGIYEMEQQELREVSNPSELLLMGDHEGLSGVVISSTIEGTRPFLVETQALVSSATYGTPQCSATSFDQRRLNMLLTVLEKRAGSRLVQKDIFLSIAGGSCVTDMVVDLSVITTVLSSNVDTPIEQGWCMCGEAGLSGEVRPISYIEQHIAETEKLGFSHIIIPKYNLSGLTGKYNIQLHPVRKVEEALRALFG